MARRAIPLGLSVLLAACGFLGEEPFRGRRAPDLAPWREIGPLMLCEADVRIGAPASMPLRACGDNGAASACTSDSDCRSRERCTCGGCQVALCSSSDECSGGFVCSFGESRCDRPCVRDSDCAPDSLCEPGQGVCRSRCTSNADCQRGETCDFGSCAVRTCATDGECDIGQRCTLQRSAGELREPAPLVVDDQVVLWLERRSGALATIWRATSSDGVRFRLSPTTPVLTGDVATQAHAPAVLRRADGGYLAIYAGDDGNLYRAVSGDGITFATDTTPLLLPSLPWQQGGLDTPALALSPDDGEILLYYGTRDRSALGVARSSDGIVFAPAAEPLLVPASVFQPVLWRDLDSIASPFAETARDPDGRRVLWLYFSARGRGAGISSEFGTPVVEALNFSVGVVGFAADGAPVPWPFNPIFDRLQSFINHAAELDPAVITLRGRRLLYYRGALADETRSSNLNVAENPASP